MGSKRIAHNDEFIEHFVFQKFTLQLSRLINLLYSFLISFMVDARGGAMHGCRHGGVRVIVPPGQAVMPTRVTCKLVRKERLLHPPPLMDGEALASRVLEVGPVGTCLLGSVYINSVTMIR